MRAQAVSLASWQGDSLQGDSQSPVSILRPGRALVGPLDPQGLTVHPGGHVQLLVVG